jgi:hypothetical protein
MPSSRSIEAGRAFLKLVIEDSEFRKSLQGSAQHLDRWGRSLQSISLKVGALGAAITTPFAVAAKKFADIGSQLHDLSGRTGATVERLSELRFAASQTGVEFGGIELAYRRMAKTIGDANRGMSGAVDGLSRLGLTVKDLQGLSPDQQFTRIANSINAITDPTEKAAAAITIFGRSGTQLLPLFAEMDALTNQARNMGLVMSKETAAAADKLGDAFDLLKASAESLVLQLGGHLAPDLTKVAESLAKITPEVSNWVRENKGAIKTVGELGAALVILAVAVNGIGTAFRAAALSMTAFRVASVFLATHPLFATATVIALGLAAVAQAGNLLTKWFNETGEAIDRSRLRELGPIIDEVQKKLDAFRAKGANSVALRYEARLNELYRERAEILQRLNAHLKPLPAQLPPLPKVPGPALPGLLPPLPNPSGLLRAQFEAAARAGQKGFSSGVLGAGPIPLPKDRDLFGNWRKAIPEALIEGLARISLPDSRSFATRSQFGGRGIEQTLGGTDLQPKMLAQLELLNKNFQRAPFLRIGNA